MNRVEYRRSWRPWALLLVLFVCYNLSVADRVILGLMTEPLKKTLRITDTQVSMLQGLAFFVSFSAVTIPFGLLADRMNRLKLAAAGTAVWSVMTALCGLSGSFAPLLAARIGVGVGEATLGPSAHSLIANAFPARRLGLAIGLYGLGGVTGASVSLIGGGYVMAQLASHPPIDLPLFGPLQPWQFTFLALGALGLILVPIVAFLPQPPRSDDVVTRTRQIFSPALRQFYRLHWRAILPHHLGVAIGTMMLLGSLMWTAPFFQRVHGWPVDRIGLWIGIAYLVAGLLANPLGGALSDVLSRRGVGMRLLLCAAAMPVAAIAAATFALTDAPVLAVVMFALLTVCGLLSVTVGTAALQVIAPDQLRGFAASVMLLLSGLITSFGPTIVALLTDRVFGGATGLRYSLLTFCVGASLLAGLCFLLAIRPFQRAAEAEAEPATAA